MDRSDPSYKGQAGYNRFMLAIYDPWVLGFMTRAVWPCPCKTESTGIGGTSARDTSTSDRERAISSRMRSRRAGPRSRCSTRTPRCSSTRSQRLAAFHSATVEADVMKPLPVQGPFDSAALSFVLHCLRGPMSNKAVAIRNIAEVLTPDGVLFGGSVLGTTEEHSRSARTFLKAANKQGGFDNLGDTADGLRDILGESFEKVDVDVVGSAALFTATKPRRSQDG